MGGKRRKKLTTFLAEWFEDSFSILRGDGSSLTFGGAAGARGGALLRKT
jgi:hypothetical protein